MKRDILPIETVIYPFCVICIGIVMEIIKHKRKRVMNRDNIKKIINLNAKSIILAHNHPSDNITPSKCDIELTNEIAKGLKNFGALLIEHIIITKNSYFSFLEEGLI